MNTNSNFFKVLSVSVAVIAVVLVLNLFGNFTSPKSKPSQIDNDTSFVLSDYYSIHSLDIPTDLSFAGEKAPTDKYWVSESFDRELLVNTYWQSQTILLIKRSNKYFPIIEPILRENGVPSDFKYLAVIESGLMPRASSPAGAKGVWQFMPATAREYDLEVNTEVDQRYDVEAATVAACKYFNKMYEKFKSWTLVAASYNAGRTGVLRQMNLQKCDNYYELLLNEETGRYVYRLLAVKEILEHPKKYGFTVKPEHLYKFIDYKVAEVDTSIKNMADFAELNNIPYKELKDLNPWLRANKLTNSGKKNYRIILPKDNTDSMQAQNNVD